MEGEFSSGSGGPVDGVNGGCAFGSFKSKSNAGRQRPTLLAHAPGPFFLAEPSELSVRDWSR